MRAAEYIFTAYELQRFFCSCVVIERSWADDLAFVN